jgi:hypothetical protein
MTPKYKGEIEMTTPQMNDRDDPNPRLQALLFKLDEEIKSLREPTWQNELAERTKKMQSLLPTPLYRDDRENLEKIIRELEKFWGLLKTAEDEKSYQDLIKVLDNWTRWIMTR